MKSKKLTRKIVSLIGIITAVSLISIPILSLINDDVSLDEEYKITDEETLSMLALRNNGNVYNSSDDENWSYKGNPEFGYKYVDIATGISGYVFILRNDGKVYFTHNGVSGWYEYGYGSPAIPSSNAYVGIAVGSGPTIGYVYVLRNDGKVYFTQNGVSGWYEYGYGSPEIPESNAYVGITAGSGTTTGYVYVLRNDGQVYFTQNGVSGWYEYGYGSPEIATSNAYVGITAGSKTTSGYIYLLRNDGMVYFTQNGVSGWYEYGYGSPAIPTSNSYLGITVGSDTTIGYAYVLRDDGKVYFTQNGVSGWYEYGYGTPAIPTSDDFTSLTTGAIPGYVYVLRDDKQVYFTNTGVSGWNQYGYGSPIAPSSSSYIDISVDSTATFALRENGTVYKSINNGVSWNDFGDAGNYCSWVSITTPDSGYIYALRSDGTVKRSSTSSAFWSDWGSAGSGIFFVSICSDTDGYLYVLGNDGQTKYATETDSTWYNKGDAGDDTCWVSITANSDHVYAMKNNRTISRASGGTSTSWSDWASAGEDSSWVSITCSSEFVYALRNDGRIDKAITIEIPVWSLNIGDAGEDTSYVSITLTKIVKKPQNIYIPPLKVGWNLVGLPHTQSVDLDDIIVFYNGAEYSWENATSNNPTGGPIVLRFVYGWNRTNQQYEIVDELIPGCGYWMYSYYECVIWVKITGIKSNDYKITDLLVGWDLVGLPVNQTTELDDIIVKYSGIDYSWDDATSSNNPTGGPIVLRFVYGWNRTNQQYEIVSELVPGYGYWMYSYYDCTLLGPTKVTNCVITTKNQILPVDFTWKPNPQKIGLPVQFNENILSPPNIVGDIKSPQYNIMSWYWDFTGFGTSTEKNPTFTFLKPGIYPVTLTVWNEEGYSESVILNVTIIEIQIDQTFTSTKNGQASTYTDSTRDDRQIAQSFVPTLSELTKISLCISSKYNKPHTAIVEIQTNAKDKWDKDIPSNNIITSTEIPFSVIPSSPTWIDFEIDACLTPGEKYWIVLKDDDLVSTSEYVIWWQKFEWTGNGETYEEGEKAYSSNNGIDWYPNKSGDRLFITHGYSISNGEVIESEQISNSSQSDTKTDDKTLDNSKKVTNEVPTETDTDESNYDEEIPESNYDKIDNTNLNNEPNDESKENSKSRTFEKGNSKRGVFSSEVFWLIIIIGIISLINRNRKKSSK